MKTSRFLSPLLAAVLLFAGAFSLCAQPLESDPSSSEFVTSPELRFDDVDPGDSDPYFEEAVPQTINHEAETHFSFATPSTLSQGNRDIGDMTSSHAQIRYVASIPVSEGIILRSGLNWDRFSFGVPDGAPMPNTLQSLNTIIGADIELSDNWLMRIDLDPGLYSDFYDLSFDDVNMPITLGASYLVDKDLQWFFGVLADPRSEIPVLPGVGFRWQFADEWTLMFLLPKPRIIYSYNEQLSFFAGAEMKSGGYMVAKDFGRRNGNRGLDNDRVAYREITLGGGVSWKFHPAVTLEVQGGYVVDRRFDYEQSDLILDSEPAAYIQAGLSTAF